MWADALLAVAIINVDVVRIGNGCVTKRVRADEDLFPLPFLEFSMDFIIDIYKDFVLELYFVLKSWSETFNYCQQIKIIVTDYLRFFPRRRTIHLSVALLRRVFLPRVGLPQGLLGDGIPIGVLPSPPP